MTISTTIRARGDGRWEIRRRVTGDTPRYQVIRGTKLDAERIAAEWRAKAPSQPPSLRKVKASGNTPVATWLRLLIDNPDARWQPNTIRTYRQLLDYWIAPANARGDQWTLGRLRLGHVTPEDIEQFKAVVMDSNTQSRGRGSTVFQCIRFVLWGFRKAVALGALAHNPLAGVQLPSHEPREVAVPTRNDIRKVHDIPDDRTRLLLVLAVYAGVRRGEALALRWSDVDLDREGGGVIVVNRSLEQTTSTAKPRLGRTKTQGSRRTIEIPGFVTDELRRARSAVASERGLPIDHFPVLHDNGGWWAPQAATDSARYWLRRMDIPGSLHGLRHAHASILLGEAEQSPHIVSKRLGHKRVETTLRIYGHVMPGDGRAASQAFERIIRGPVARRRAV